MKRLLLLAGLAAALGLAAPAHADRGDAGDAQFLAALSGSGLSHRASDGVAIAAGRSVCQLMDNGFTPMDTVIAVQSTNPGFTMEHAARFTAIAVTAYCPEHM
ncbi:MAG TPA: DUF732 domain-containing protein [Mycobacterium sp.]|nr:DUF732 domain-containing protein [Mycobacterium sp.]